MARTEHGISLSSPRLQPGSKFRQSKRGFDTGSRTYAIDTSMYEARVYSIGRSDPEGIHPTMFIQSIDKEERELGVTFFTINLEGIIKRDGESGVLRARDRQVQSQPADITTTARVAGDLTRITYRAYELVVTDVYVTDEQPNLGRIGKQESPPGFEPIGIDTAALSAVAGVQSSDYGWRVENLQYTEAGLSETSRTVMYEVTETFRFRPPPVRIKTFIIAANF